MKIITMKRLTLDGKPLDHDNDCDPNDWWCVIETKEEEMVYDKAHTEGEYAVYEDLWNAMVVHAGEGFGLAWGDDDVYGYIRPDSVCPDLLEKYTDADGDEWLRME